MLLDLIKKNFIKRRNVNSMLTLKEIFEKYGEDVCKEPVSKTHNDLLLKVLNAYHPDLADKAYCVFIQKEDNCLIFGQKKNNKNIEEALMDSQDDKFFKRLTSVKCDDLLKNKLYWFILPLTADNSPNCKYFLVLKDKKDLELLGIKCIEDFYTGTSLSKCIFDNFINCFINSDLPENSQQYGLDKTFAIFHLPEWTTTNSVFHELSIPKLKTINEIANWNYEGAENKGIIEFIDSEQDISNIIKFAEDVRFSNKPRLIRKLLEMTSEDLHLICIRDRPKNNEFIDKQWRIIGLGNTKESKNLKRLQFCGKNSWKFSYSNEEIEYNGVNYIFRNSLFDSFIYKRELETFASNYNKDVSVLKKIVEAATKQYHGTTIVFLDNASDEAERLCSSGRGIRIQPQDIKDNTILIKLISRIDGAVLCDFTEMCYSIGTILDGEAYKESDSSRGARYNSSISYVHKDGTESGERLAVVISEDKTVDVVYKSKK